MKFKSGTFTGQKNMELFYRAYEPDGKTAAVLLLVHGLFEHSGRYINLMNYFVPRGYSFYTFDQRGHGQSAGKPGYVEKFSFYLDDLKTFFDLVRRENPLRKVFLAGHSIGGLIVTEYALQHQKEFDGLIISGATFQPGTSAPKAEVFLGRILSVCAPWLGIDRLDASAISRDKNVVDAYLHDPLVYRGKITARLGIELLDAMHNFQSHTNDIRIPILIMSGTEDYLSDPKSSKVLFDSISSKDKTLKYYDGFYHEIFNEPGSETVFVDMEYWLATHL